MVYEDEHGVMYVNDDMSIYHVLGSFVHPGAVVYKDEHGVMYVNDDMSIYHVSGSLYTLGLWCTRMNMV